ncbi:putative Ig domain-containing protein [bacterium]|nr:putative Ig domain-containing protein [bacterium]
MAKTLAQWNKFEGGLVYADGKTAEIGNNLVERGAPSCTWPAGRWGYSIQQPNSSNQLYIPNFEQIVTTTGISHAYEFWFMRPTAKGAMSNSVFMDNNYPNDANSAAVVFQHYAGNTILDIGKPGSTVNITFANQFTVLDKWYYVLIVVNRIGIAGSSNSVRVYIASELDAPVLAGSSNAALGTYDFTNNNRLTIGNSYAYPAASPGQIDNAKVYNFASETEQDITDLLDNRNTETYGSTVAPTLPANITFTPGTVGVAYDETFGQQCTGTQPITLSVGPGTPAAGLQLDTAQTDGTIRVYGTPSAVDLVPDWIINAANGTAPNDFQQISTPIIRTAVEVTDPGLTNGTKDEAYGTVDIGATGGTGAYTWSLDSGAIPTGMTLVQVGNVYRLSGTPTATGTFDFTVKATDNESREDTLPLQIIVRDALTITTTTLPDASQNTAYTPVDIAASGGETGTYTWSTASGSLPAGMSLAQVGQSYRLSGTPTESGTFNFTVQVDDGESRSDTQPLQLVVDSVIIISTRSLPTGRVGDAYTATISATGGSTPYVWSQTAGNLQTGLSIAQVGNDYKITGTPTGGFPAWITVKVTGNNGATASEQLQLRITGSRLGPIEGFYNYLNTDTELATLLTSSTNIIEEPVPDKTDAPYLGYDMSIPREDVDGDMIKYVATFELRAVTTTQDANRRIIARLGEMFFGDIRPYDGARIGSIITDSEFHIRHAKLFDSGNEFNNEDKEWEHSVIVRVTYLLKIGG